MGNLGSWYVFFDMYHPPKLISDQAHLPMQQDNAPCKNYSGMAQEPNVLAKLPNSPDPILIENELNERKQAQSMKAQTLQPTRPQTSTANVLVPNIMVQQVRVALAAQSRPTQY